ncbi:oxygen-insensitive NADPH nitroreductase [Desulforhopalus singaporensis]|uniref:Nitroreductase family protein n=1 Tax=Desulforhopalus singaporensis TaxID=91360 RepID=A0A1H0VME9_9BACT|nr:oxygen-insensitive NADPH nitroreductase [Desulforhopalus singaporensis]SDP79620.1 Nitroreductase family protein [Desulforhopalus singaporensis]
MNKVIRVMKTHRSIRNFTEKQVDEEVITIILNAARQASTSNFIQAYSIIRVNDPASRKKIATLAGNQTWVVECPLFFVFCADLKRSELACKMQNRQMLTGYTEQFIIATVDVALVAQNTMLAAESLGLGGVFIGGIRNDPVQLCEILDIPEQVYPVFGLCLGYPSDVPEVKPRLPLEVIVKEEKYSFDDLASIKAYDQTCNKYYRERSDASREDNWTKQIARMTVEPMRPHMKDFIRSKGFDLQ